MNTRQFKPSELIEAIKAASLDRVLSALQNGADVNEPDVHGYPGLPLRTACFAGNVPIIRELLARGADVNAATADGPGAPIRLCLRAGHREIAALLIAHDAEIPFGSEIDAELLHRAEVLAGRAPEQPVAALEFEPVALTLATTPDRRAEFEPENALEFVSPTVAPSVEYVEVKGGAYGVDTNILAIDFERANGPWEKVERAQPAKPNNK